MIFKTFQKGGLGFILLLLFLQPLAGKEKTPETQPKTRKPMSASERARQLFGPKTGEMLHLSLDECLHRALTYNPELEVADYSIDVAREKVNEVDKILNPVFEYEYDIAPVPQNVRTAISSFFTGDITIFDRVKLGMGVPLNTFGKVKTGKELAEIGVRAERQRKVLKKSEIVMKVKQLYYGILLAEEVGHLLSSARDNLDQEVKKKEEETEKGTAGVSNDPTALLKLKLFRSDLDKRLQEGQRREILAREALAVTMGLDPSLEFELNTDKLRAIPMEGKTFEEYRDKALAERPDLKLLELGYQAKEKQVELEKKLMLPNIGLGAFFEIARTPNVIGLGTTDDFTDPFNFTRAGFGFQLKGDFDFHTSFSKLRQAQSELYKIDVQKDFAEDGVQLEVKEAFLDVESAKDDMDRADDSGKLSRQLLFLSQSNFDIGLAEPKDLVEALGAFLQTRGAYFESIFNYNIAVATLDQKSGKTPD
jgi:outer membrane protein TolC